MFVLESTLVQLLHVCTHIYKCERDGGKDRERDRERKRDGQIGMECEGVSE